MNKKSASVGKIRLAPCKIDADLGRLTISSLAKQTWNDYLASFQLAFCKAKVDWRKENRLPMR